jgi:hypothetical protein
MDIVNGYQCRNCTDVDYAKRHIDPAHPKDGPFGINKTNGVERGPAVVLGGGLASVAGVSAVNGVNAIGASSAVTPVPPVKPVVYQPGASVDLSV